MQCCREDSELDIRDLGSGPALSYNQGADRSLPQIPHLYDMLWCLLALRIYSVSIACREKC